MEAASAVAAGVLLSAAEESAAEESAVELEFVELAQAVAETAIAAAAIAAKIFLLICPFYVGMRFWTLALLGFRSLKLPAHTLIIAHILLKCNFSLQ